MSRPKNRDSFWNRLERAGSGKAGTDFTGYLDPAHVVEDIALRDDTDGEDPGKQCWVTCTCGASYNGDSSEDVAAIFEAHRGPTTERTERL